MADRLYIPSYVKITRVSEDSAQERVFVICNEATGHYWRANAATVELLDAINRTGTVEDAQRAAGIAAAHAGHSLDHLLATGVVVRSGTTSALGRTPKAPIESRLIVTRFDLADIAGVARLLRGPGQILFSRVGGLLWGATLTATLLLLQENGDKLHLTLAGFSDLGLGSALALAAAFVLLKVVHELGHALAYQAMCRRERVNSGPIRAGILIFAMSPLPFTDVTGAWRLRSRWRRAMIGFGGVYLESWTIALLVIFWASTAIGPLQTVLIQVSVISAVSMLVFNFNPAARLDGYYILTDLLGRANLATNAARAARTWFARRMGAKLPPPTRFDLSYWCVAYLYRWVIFSGIFWLAYRFDPRLAVPVLFLVLIMLIVRPLAASFAFARRAGVRSGRVAAAAGSIAALAALGLIPLPHHLRLDGRWVSYETRFVQAAEPARVDAPTVGSALALASPDLAQQRRDVAIRSEMLENALRNVQESGAQKAGVESDLGHLREVRVEYDRRLSGLAIGLDGDEVWTPLAVRHLTGSWVAAGGESLGAVSTPVEPYLRLELPQRLVEGGLLARSGGEIASRLRHDPRCRVRARLTNTLLESLARSDVFVLRASIDNPPACAADLRNGAALVAWIEAEPMSVLGRIRTGASRLLQDRLPVEQAANREDR